MLDGNAPCMPAPLTVTVPVVPTTFIWRPRPPQSPYPFRCVTTRSVRRPIEGQRASMADTAILAIQLWRGPTESVGSGTAFSYPTVPGEVKPPVDDEYSAQIGFPP